MALTVAKIRSLKPADRAYKVADQGGLYLNVSPTGARSWRWNYHHAGRAKTLTLGQFPEIGLQDARIKLADGQSLEPGAILRMAGNWKVTAVAPQQSQQAGEFLKHLTHRIAAGVGVPVWLVTSDVSQANYSSLRAALVAFRQRVERYQFQTLVPQFLDPVWQRVATMAALDLGIEIDDDLFAVEWIPPAQPWVDPAKDARATVEQMEAGLMSRRQAVAALGYSIEKLDAEIAADRERESALGLSFGKPIQHVVEQKVNDNE